MKDGTARKDIAALKEALEAKIKEIERGIPHLRNCPVCGAEAYHITTRFHHAHYIIMLSDSDWRTYTDIHTCLRCGSRFEDETSSETKAVLITNPDYPRDRYAPQQISKPKKK